MWKTRKMETIINKSDLFNYLDQYDFVEENEIQSAILDYIEKQENVIYYSDCLLAGDLADEYIKKNDLNFNEK